VSGIASAICISGTGRGQFNAISAISATTGGLFQNATRVARIFLVRDTKTGKNEHKMYRIVIYYSKYP
jgi:hypothetical protein